MKNLNKILLVESEPYLSFEICNLLKKSDFYVTDVVPYLFNVLKSTEKSMPDIIMIDTYFTEQQADFIADYIKLPIILITNQPDSFFHQFDKRIKIIAVLKKQFLSNEIKSLTSLAINKLKNAYM